MNANSKEGREQRQKTGLDEARSVALKPQTLNL